MLSPKLSANVGINLKTCAVSFVQFPQIPLFNAPQRSLVVAPDGTHTHTTTLLKPSSIRYILIHDVVGLGLGPTEIEA